jgi:hypothetical protein
VSRKPGRVHPVGVAVKGAVGVLWVDELTIGSVARASIFVCSGVGCCTYTTVPSARMNAWTGVSSLTPTVGNHQLCLVRITRSTLVISRGRHKCSRARHLLAFASLLRLGIARGSSCHAVPGGLQVPSRWRSRQPRRVRLMYDHGVRSCRRWLHAYAHSGRSQWETAGPASRRRPWHPAPSGWDAGRKSNVVRFRANCTTGASQVLQTAGVPTPAYAVTPMLLHIGVSYGSTPVTAITSAVTGTTAGVTADPHDLPY